MQSNVVERNSYTLLSVDTKSITIDNQQASITLPMAPERCDYEEENKANRKKNKHTGREEKMMSFD